MRLGMTDFEGHSQVKLRPTSHRPLAIGLVNIMPVAARVATERQFGTLLTTASGSQALQLQHFIIGVATNNEEGYKDVADIFDCALDGMIVTGTEPKARNLKEEPLWPMITRLVDWAEENAIATVWSCLSGHAAVLHLDKVDRIPRTSKLSGIFRGEIVHRRHGLTQDVEQTWLMPHSRWNDLSESQLRAKDYEILVRSDDAGVAMFAKTRSAPFVFFQGHPEYEADTLMREFQRDVRRYHRRETTTFPAPPRNYFQNGAEATLVALRAAASAVGDNLDEMQVILNELSGKLPPRRWLHTAVAVYRNWINDIVRRKLELCPETPMFQRVHVSHELGKVEQLSWQK
jgi:homoserine O-succinyltransferase